jgi:hypothetical protein
MSAKKATAAVEPDRPLTKAEACNILQVAPTADEEMITAAYWHLARKYRAYKPSDPESKQRLHELNHAFVALHPGLNTAPLTPEMTKMEEVPPPPGFFDQLFLAWQKLVEHTKAVWPEHVGEVTALSATTAFLTYLALSSGANPIWTLAVAGIAGLAIWAPWRRAG